MENNSVIGKKYYPIDNSYACCYNEIGVDFQLAGNHYDEPKQPEEVEIVSEPYEFWIWTYREPQPYTFVDVKCKRGFIHRTMFGEYGFKQHVNRPMTLPSFLLY